MHLSTSCTGEVSVGECSIAMGIPPGELFGLHDLLSDTGGFVEADILIASYWFRMKGLNVHYCPAKLLFD